MSLKCHRFKNAHARLHDESKCSTTIDNTVQTTYKQQSANSYNGVTLASKSSWRSWMVFTTSFLARLTCADPSVSMVSNSNKYCIRVSSRVTYSLLLLRPVYRSILGRTFSTFPLIWSILPSLSCSTSAANSLGESPPCSLSPSGSLAWRVVECVTSLSHTTGVIWTPGVGWEKVL